MEELKDILHSENIGDIALQLVKDEVEFLPDTTAIAAALQGIECQHYIWYLQTGEALNCEENGISDVCIKRRETGSPVVQFRNVRFKHGVKYTSCAYTTNCGYEQICSNGFIVDTHPPLPGQVYVGHDESYLQTDSTSIFIHWEGFQDLETETTLPYANGIKEYSYGIGEKI